LIRAGFKLELEDETDGASKHCEFSAMSKGKKYWVEATSGQPLTYDIAIGMGEESRVPGIGFEGCRIPPLLHAVAQLRTTALAKKRVDCCRPWIGTKNGVTRGPTDFQGELKNIKKICIFLLHSKE
jgi:hypothetical protein